MIIKSSPGLCRSQSFSRQKRSLGLRVSTDVPRMNHAQLSIELANSRDDPRELGAEETHAASQSL
jgi:hypothetical protein